MEDESTIGWVSEGEEEDPASLSPAGDSALASDEAFEEEEEEA
jgi:hypothetical protein